jgi:hypothetical protein
MNTESLLNDLFTVLLKNGIVFDMNAVNQNQDSQNLRLVSKKHGFKPNKIDGHFEVRYKDGDSWLPTRKIIYTENEGEAVDFAITEKQNIIREYKERKKSRKQRRAAFSYIKCQGITTLKTAFTYKRTLTITRILSPLHK